MKKIDQDLVKRLLLTHSPSGNEFAIRELIKEEITNYVDEIFVDKLGNLIARKKADGPKIMLAAHMDQIGLMVTHIDDKGYIRFTNIGGFSPSIALSQKVIFRNGTVGVIASERIENLKDLTLEKLYIDIGANSRKDAEKRVSIGDVCTYHGEVIIDDNKIISHALDDRIGCYILIETLKKLVTAENDLYFVFTVQEEVGLRGAKTAAFAIDPDYGIALDVTATGDTPKCLPMAVELGSGPAVKVKDNSILCHPLIKDFMVKTAESNSIPYQLEVLEFGGTDGGAIHLTRLGVPTGVLSIPCRYIHSNCEMVFLTDIVNAMELLKKMLVKKIELE